MVQSGTDSTATREGRYARCRKRLARDDSTIDHIIAQATGGKSSLPNGWLTGLSCRTRKPERPRPSSGHEGLNPLDSGNQAPATVRPNQLAALLLQNPLVQVHASSRHLWLPGPVGQRMRRWKPPRQALPAAPDCRRQAWTYWPG